MTDTNIHNLNQVRILFFGRLADLVSQPQITQAVHANTSAKVLYQQLGEQYPELPMLEKDPSIKVAINQTLVNWDSPVRPGDEVAFMPPVTGG